MYINGQYVTQGPAPGYPWHYYYNRVDVRKYLQPGRNVIAVHTYYQGLINRVWVSGDGRHGLIFDLVCDGEVFVKSDTSVRCRDHSGYRSLGTTGYQTQFLECYDSRAEETDFAAPSCTTTVRGSSRVGVEIWMWSSMNSRAILL